MVSVDFDVGDLVRVKQSSQWYKQYVDQVGIVLDILPVWAGEAKTVYVRVYWNTCNEMRMHEPDPDNNWYWSIEKVS